MTIRPAMRIALLACAGLVFSATAAGPRTFAVVSLIGDSITVVSQQQQIGSLVDHNTHNTVELPPTVIDNGALLATDDAVRSADSSAVTVLLSIASKPLRDRQSELVTAGQLGAAPELTDALKKSGAGYLLLFTKHRSDAGLDIYDGKVGNGTLYGLGFYVDHRTVLGQSDSEENARGFLAPYAYFDIYLIDLATSKVLGERTITASNTFSNSENKVSSDPWDILSLEGKFKALNDLVKAQITTEVPALIR